MKKNFNLLFLIVAILIQQHCSACSIFSCSRNGQVLVGSNEDSLTSFRNIWFVPAKEGKYGAVFFGQNDMQTQAGMNEHGLFFDFAAIPRIEPKGGDINFITLAEILSTCKNVEEALKVYEKYTYASYSSQMLLADATGKSVLINADTIVHKTGDYQITTNFNICDLRGKGYDCLRYDKINRALASSEEISISLFQNILGDVHQEGVISTQNSSVYDLKARKIYMNLFHDYSETVEIDLQEELKKGFRIEKLGDRFKKKNFAAINFQESEEGYFYNMLLNEFEQNGLDGGIKFFEHYIKINPDKSEAAKNDLNWIPYGLIAKARVAYDNLSFDYYYIPALQRYKPIWKSNDKLLYEALDILGYIKEQELIDGDFFFHENLGYINMVMGNKQIALEHYERAIAVSEKDSRESNRATLMLQLIKSEDFSHDIKKNFKYLEQAPPSLNPKVFAPDLISKNNEYEFGSVFNKQGTEFYYGVDINGKAEIRYTKFNGSSWSPPNTLLEHPVYGYNDPFLSPDENRLYFISRRAMDGKSDPKDYDIWYVEKEKTGWSEPKNAGSNINSKYDEYYISFTKSGKMYFSSNKKAAKEQRNNFDIYSSKQHNGQFQEPIILGSSVNTPNYEADVFVDPNESYIIFCAQREDGLGQGDLYISFKKSDGSWSKSKNMGAAINSKGHELCPFVTADGKYLFYTSNQDIYWVSTEIIEKVRTKE